MYKGEMEDGSMVAVKKLKEHVRKDNKELDFQSELEMTSNVRHRNLLPVQGWCFENGEAILVYRYMRKGSLDKYLYGEKRGTLSRDTRYKILQGVALALEYLHSGLPYCVLHRDVKAANVLLADDYEPMLGDFGLARELSHIQRQGVSMTGAGTTGYIAPEVVFERRFSDKADVYGFGVLALEVACGRAAIDNFQVNPHEVRLLEWAWSLHLRDQLIEALDSGMRLGMSPHQEQQWMGVLYFALMCCNPQADMRPTMQQVSQTLQGADNMLLTQPLPRNRSYVPPPQALESWPSASCSSSSVHEGRSSQMRPSH